MYVYTHCQEKLPVMPSLSRSLSERCLEGPAPVNAAMVRTARFVRRRQHTSTRRNKQDWRSKFGRHPSGVAFTEGDPSSSNSYNSISSFLSPHTYFFFTSRANRNPSIRESSAILEKKRNFYNLDIAHFMICSPFLF